MKQAEVQPVPVRTLAALDIGSNSFHLLIARQQGAGFHVIDRVREAVRLGSSFDGEGNLSEAAAERALEALSRAGQRLKGFPPENVRAIGTNALRRARNSDAFLARAMDALGYPIDIVSGVEEARLIYSGVAHSLAVDDARRRLVIDIGGGSTELIIGQGATPSVLESLEMGCVTLTERFFPGGRLTRKAFAAAQLAARQEIEAVEAEFRSRDWDEAVGASGTVRTLEDLCQRHGGSTGGITLDALLNVADKLHELAEFSAFTRLGVSVDRSLVLAGGLAILIAVMESLQIRQIVAADGALREGALLDLIGRLEHRDVRDATVDVLARRMQTDIEHGLRVQRSAAYLLEGCAPSWELAGKEGERMLGWAARLCELGLAISHSGFHKHGAYILANADLAGFSRSEQRLLATLVRAHRRKFPKSEFEALPRPWNTVAPRLAVILRLAVLLNRSRLASTTPDAECDACGLRLAFPAGWLAAHPLTRADLELEAEQLRAAGFDLRFS